MHYTGKVLFPADVALAVACGQAAFVDKLYGAQAPKKRKYWKVTASEYTTTDSYLVHKVKEMGFLIEECEE